MAELGYIALVLALVGAVFAITGSVFGGKAETSWINRNARKAVIAVFFLMSAAVVILEAAILTHHFEIQYVYQYTDRSMSPLYLFSALWAGNAGSLLIWAWFISLCGYILVLRQRPGKRELTPYTLAVVMTVQLFFTSLVLFFTNPFTRLDAASFPVVPSDGTGMNPLLENPGMVLHPPTLIAGFALFVVPFAYALSALLNNRLDNTWISHARRWMIMAWLLLGAGNLIGAWWAYAVLGWGGYWGWDPIENAGLIPWLVATAAIHSMVVQKRRGGFKLWTLSLTIAVFVLIKTGAFLARSDILSSVHTFGRTAMDPMFLTLIGISLAGSIVLLVWRRKSLKSEMSIENLVSREATFLLSNLLLVGAAAVTLIGTLAPILPGSVNLDTSFYNRAVVPILVAIVLLIGICVTIGWRRLEMRRLRSTLLVSAGAALGVVAILLFAGFSQWYALVPVFIAVFTISSSILTWFRDTLARRKALSESFVKASLNLVGSNRARYGGYLVHISIAVMAIGVIGSSVYKTEASEVLAPGESMDVSGYTITYQTLLGEGDSTRMEVWAVLDVYKDERHLGEMKPVQLTHANYQGWMARVAIRYSMIEDLYISLTGWEPVDADDPEKGYWAGFMVDVNPLVSWIWAGGVLFLAGGLTCYWPRGKKQPSTGSED